ncbi:TolC family protein [Pontibacter silvestris]|uniref:TolC family protein n=1 Tax=Pontibacter silvestris TaxID=2305183 RepID=A0ABW4WWS2_9BACT|nr:TolC family protein [Pontibacter silvestris]MCC9136986.1 TolC family protein [Pontibacter silvestris]
MSFPNPLNKLLCFFFLLSLVSSCKVFSPPQPQPLPARAKMPDSFNESTDTTSLADLSWNNFFNDEHLVSLIDIALQNNPDLMGAYQRMEVARANYDIARGAMLPSLDARFRARSGNIYNNLLSGTIYGDRNTVTQTQNHFLGLQSTWEIDLWGKLKNRKKAAYVRFLATEKGQQLLTTELIAEVARLYYELLGLDNELEAIDNNIELQETALEIIKIQKIGGRATELAVQQFQAQLLRTKSLGFEKRQRITEVENQLNLLLGRYPQPIARGESILLQHLPDVVNAGVPSDMLLRRPDIQQAELELLAAKADVEAARAAFLPSFTITPYAGFHTRSLPSIFNTPESLVLGFLGGVTAPIFQNRVIRSDYNKTIALNKEAFYSYQKSILTGYQEVVSNLQKVENYKSAYALREQEAEVLTNAVSTSNDLFMAGYATYLEVITAQGSVLDAELSKANTRKEIFLALIDLYRSLGGGWK